jgi:prevent-host-death family protein
MSRRRIINVHEAKTTLSKLLRRVQAGEEIVIAKNGHPVARLVPIADAPPKRGLGFAAGRIHIARDFDAPLPADL